IARTDWVMVCSSTFNARAVIHSTKRRNPGRGKAPGKGGSSACQMDQRSVASVIGTSPSGAVWESNHPAGSARPMSRSRGDRSSVGVEQFRGNYCIIPEPIEDFGGQFGGVGLVHTGHTNKAHGW